MNMKNEYENEYEKTIMYTYFEKHALLLTLFG